MAFDTPVIRKRRVLGAGLQTDTGTAAALDGDDCKMITYDLNVERVDSPIARPNMAGFGSFRSKRGPLMGRVSFWSELVGNGASGMPFWATNLLPACNMSLSSTTWSVAKTNDVVTLVEWADGLKRGIQDARGGFTIELEPGQPVRLRWEFMGRWIQEADESLPSATLPTTLPPIFEGATVLFGGSHIPRFSSMSIAAGQQVMMRPDGASAGGYRSAAITDVLPTGEVDPEATLAATRDWEALIEAATEEALSIVVGSATNNTCTIASSKMQFIRATNTDREGLEAKSIGMQFNGASPFTLQLT